MSSLCYGLCHGHRNPDGRLEALRREVEDEPRTDFIELAGRWREGTFFLDVAARAGQVVHPAEIYVRADVVTHASMIEDIAMPNH
jgi:hypothetical protein